MLEELPCRYGIGKKLDKNRIPMIGPADKVAGCASSMVGEMVEGLGRAMKLVSGRDLA